MKKLLFILLAFALPSFGALNLMTWDGSASSDFNDTANWTGTVASGSTLGTGDSCLMNAGSVAATASGAVSIGALVTTSGYTGALSFSGQTLTIAGVVASFDNASALNLGDLVDMQNTTSTLHVGTGITTMTAPKWVKGTGNFTVDFDEIIQHVDSLTLADNSKLTNTGSSALYCRNFLLGSTDTLVLNTFINIYPASSGRQIKYTDLPVINGSETLYFTMALPNILDTIPKLKLTGTGQDIHIYFTTGLSGGTSNYFIEDTLQATDQINFYNAVAGYGIITLNNNLTCANLLIGTTNATAKLTVNNGSTTLNIGTFTGSTYNTAPNATFGTFWNFETSTITCTGSWTGGTNHVEYNPGTSTVTFNGTAAHTVTSNGPTKTFYDIVVSNTATNGTTFADTLRCRNLTVQAANTQAVTLSTGAYISGSVTADGSGAYSWGSPIKMTGSNYTFHIGSTAGIQTMTATAFNTFGTGTFDIDKLDTIGPITAADSVLTTIGGAGIAYYGPIEAKRLTNSDSARIQKLTMPVAAKWTLKANTGIKLDTIGDLTGSAGALDSIVSGTVASPARLYLSGNFTPSYLYMRDICTPVDTVFLRRSNGCLSGGGNVCP